jgi:hypothetical protein
MPRSPGGASYSSWYGTPQWRIEAFRRFEIPEALITQDYLSRTKMAYLGEGARPSHRWYGWVTG